MGRKKKPDIRVGTSGWTYDDWQERFYPSGVSGADRLSYYAEHFDTVEVNATFYRFPTSSMIKSWNRRLPPSFHLVIKGNQGITHRKRLADCEELLSAFLGRVDELERAEVILWQLPPSLHKDVGRLEEFLKLLPDRYGHAMEFRHESWWDEDVYEILRAHEAAMVAVSHPKLPPDVVSTADFLYVRFHGKGSELYRYHYSKQELAGWVGRLTPHLDGRRLYAFFNNDYEANAVENAREFREMMLK